MNPNQEETTVEQLMEKFYEEPIDFFTQIDHYDCDICEARETKTHQIMCDIVMEPPAPNSTVEDVYTHRCASCRRIHGPRDWRLNPGTKLLAEQLAEYAARLSQQTGSTWRITQCYVSQHGTPRAILTTTSGGLCRAWWWNRTGRWNRSLLRMPTS